MALSEIEKLERRYAENPQGLTFAPLAEVHRKTGEVQRALDLLGPGLQLHPDYIPASIVLGRCHMDLGDVHTAETAFLHVLDLDGENVIALKALADISERLLKFDDAERWLHMLLTVDRSNDDAREQLQRVEIARRQAGVASSAEPTVVDSPPEAEVMAAAPAVELIPDIAPPPPRFEPPPEPATPSLGFDDLEPSALRSDFVDEPSALRFDEPAPFEEPVVPIDGLVGQDVDTPDELPASVRDDANEFRSDFSVELSEDIVLESAGGSEFQVPDASQELFASGAKGERAPFEEDMPVPSAAPPPEPEMAAAPEVVAPEVVEPEVVLPEVAELEELREPERYEPARYQPEPYQPEPFVPEPVAADLAAPEHEPLVYEPPPPPPPAPPPAPEPAVAAALPVPVAPKRAYGINATGGRSINQMFKGILSARPPMQSAPPAVRQPPPVGTSGAPTRPAADSLSLSSVFGDDSSDTPPAMPAPGAGGGSVSFDDFFGATGATPAARTPRAPDPKNDDLDQFHAWLQNLKR